MKKSLSLLLILLLLISLLVSCKDGGASLTVYVGEATNALDPKKCVSKADDIYIANLFSGLYEYVKNDNGIYELKCADAADFPTVQKTEAGKYLLTICLRDDLVWSNGEKLTPEDYVYSWNAAAEYSLYTDKGYVFSMIDGYSTFLDYEDEPSLNMTYDNKSSTFTVVINENTERFLAYTTMPVMYPVSRIAVRDSKKWAEDPEEFASNGRFTLKQLSEDKLVAVRNENYRDKDSVVIDEITFLFDETAAKQRLDAGKLDFSFTDVSSNFEIVSGLTYLAFNAYDASIGVYTEEAQTNIRKAIGIYAQHSGAFENKAPSLIPGISDRSASNNDHGMSMLDYADFLMQSVAESSDLFTWQDGKAYEFPILTALCAGRDGEEKALEKIAAFLLEKGITLRIRNTSWNAFLDERDGGDYSFLINSWSNVTSSHGELLYLFTSDSIYNDTKKGTVDEDTWSVRYDDVLATTVENCGDANINFGQALVVLEGSELVVPLSEILRKLYSGEGVSVQITLDGIVRFG